MDDVRHVFIYSNELTPSLKALRGIDGIKGVVVMLFLRSLNLTLTVLSSIENKSDKISEMKERGEMEDKSAFTN